MAFNKLKGNPWDQVTPNSPSNTPNTSDRESDRIFTDDSARSEVLSNLGGSQLEDGEVDVCMEDDTVPDIPVWQQCGLPPPKRLPICRKTIDTSEVDGRVETWMDNCKRMIEEYKNLNAIMKESRKEFQSAHASSMARFRELQEKHECVRAAVVYSKFRNEVEKEFKGEGRSYYRTGY